VEKRRNAGPVRRAKRREYMMNDEEKYRSSAVGNSSCCLVMLSREWTRRKKIAVRVTPNLVLATIMVARSHSSAAGVLALLSEPDPVFKQHALKSLNSLVSRFWAEISEDIALMSVYLSYSRFSKT